MGNWSPSVNYACQADEGRREGGKDGTLALALLGEAPSAGEAMMWGIDGNE